MNLFRQKATVASTQTWHDFRFRRPARAESKKWRRRRRGGIRLVMFYSDKVLFPRTSSGWFISGWWSWFISGRNSRFGCVTIRYVRRFWSGAALTSWKVTYTGKRSTSSCCKLTGLPKAWKMDRGYRCWFRLYIIFSALPVHSSYLNCFCAKFCFNLLRSKVFLALWFWADLLD